MRRTWIGLLPVAVSEAALIGDADTGGLVPIADRIRRAAGGRRRVPRSSLRSAGRLGDTIVQAVSLRCVGVVGFDLEAEVLHRCHGRIGFVDAYVLSG